MSSITMTAPSSRKASDHTVDSIEDALATATIQPRDGDPNPGTLDPTRNATMEALDTELDKIINIDDVSAYDQREESSMISVQENTINQSNNNKKKKTSANKALDYDDPTAFWTAWTAGHLRECMEDENDNKNGKSRKCQCFEGLGSVM
mmetsp:Transcript_11295/g.17475  ORF Transcript_11295/g.17475 Transcript_11295/m.17475 type:complete len:149 (+) Transcript_11295:46-492(+)